MKTSVSRVLAMAMFTLSLSACGNPAIQKVMGTGGDVEHPIVVGNTPTAVTIENRTGRPLVNIRIDVEAEGQPSPFFLIVPTVDTDKTGQFELQNFRSEDAVLLDTGVMKPKQIKVTTRDMMSKSYEATAEWK